jgi:hypothetical protein
MNKAVSKSVGDKRAAQVMAFRDESQQRSVKGANQRNWPLTQLESDLCWLASSEEPRPRTTFHVHQRYIERYTPLWSTLPLRQDLGAGRLAPMP